MKKLFKKRNSSSKEGKKSFRDHARNNRLLIRISKWFSLVVLFIGAVVSMVFGSLQIAKKSEDNIAQFGDSYNVKYNVSLKMDKPNGTLTNYNDLLVNGPEYLTDESKVIKTANAFQLWMYDNDIYNTGVQYQINGDKATIETNVYNIPKIDWSSDDTKDKKSQYLSKILFQNTNNNFIQIVKYNKGAVVDGVGVHQNLINGGMYANGQKILTSNGFDFSTAKAFDKKEYSNDNNEKYSNLTDGVTVDTYANIDISDFSTLKEQANELDASASSSPSPSSITTYAEGDDSSEGETDQKAILGEYKWYVFKDLGHVIKRLNYVQLVSIWHQILEPKSAEDASIFAFDKLINEGVLPNILSFPGLNKYEKIYYLTNDLYNALLPEERNWGDAVAQQVLLNDGKNEIVWVNDTNILDFYNQYVTNITSDLPRVNDKLNKTYDKGYFDSNLKTIVDPYIIDTITYENYTDYFPKAKVLNEFNTSNLKGDTDTNIFRFTQSSKLFSSVKDHDKNQGIINFLKNKISSNPGYVNQNYTIVQNGQYDSVVNSNKKAQGSQLFPKGIQLTDLVYDNAKNGWKEFLSSFGTAAYLGGPVLRDSVTTLNSYNSTFLASGIILFIVAIIVSVLYRVPGLFGAIALITSTVISTALNFIIGLTFSFGSVLAIFAGMILTLTSIVTLMERARKNIKDNVSIFDASNHAWKKTLMTLIDIHIVSIIIGLGLSFWGKLEIVDFGFQLILSAFISLVVVFAYFVLYFVNLINEPYFWKGKLLYAKLAYTKKVPQWYEKLTTKFNWKGYTITSCIGFCIFLLVLILTFTVGIPNSLVYNDGTSLYIYQSLDSDTLSKIDRALGLGWTLTSSNESFTLFQKSSVVSSSSIINTLNTYGINAANVVVARSVSHVPELVAGDNLSAMSISAGLVMCYAVIRFNIWGMIAIFFGTMLGTLVGMSFNYIFYIDINSYFTYVAIFAFVISNIVAFVMISTIKSRFNKKEIFEVEDIKNFISLNIKQSKNYFWMLFTVLSIMTVFFMIFMSVSLVITFVSMFITTIIATLFTVVTATVIYYGFIIVRQKYMQNIVYNVITNESSKYDAMDEELVKNINYFE